MFLNYQKQSCFCKNNTSITKNCCGYRCQPCFLCKPNNCFCSNRGPTGPTGATGPAGSVSQAFGGIYGISLETITLLPSQEVILPLLNQFPSSNITYGTNSIIINKAGVYELNFNSMTYASIVEEPFVLSVYIRLNGIRRFPFSTVFPINASMKQFGYSGFATLQEGDVLEIAMETLDGGIVSFGYDISSELTVKKVD